MNLAVRKRNTANSVASRNRVVLTSAMVINIIVSNEIED
jgi:hypothetical protein